MTPEDAVVIRRRYEAGDSPGKIAKDYGIVDISHWVIKAGGAMRSISESKRLQHGTSGKETKAAVLYDQLGSTHKVAAVLGVSQLTVRRAVGRVGNLRTPREAQRWWRNTTTDETVFNDPALEECAYWMGMVASDGCVHRTQVNLALSIVDEAHVERFRRFTKTSSRLYRTKAKPRWLGKNLLRGGTYCLGTASSPVLVAALKAYGIGPRKSLTFSVDPRLQDNRHFWRGMIDGDGWTSFTGGLTARYHIGLCGSHASVQQFREYCIRQGYTGRAEVRVVGKISYFRLHGRAAERVIRLLYEGNTVSLPRKQAVFDRLALHVA